jgi:asparagine synthase (glutamine-hydrolysing)
MCGITGQYFFKSEAPVTNNNTDLAVKSLSFRGPDNQNVVQFGRVSLGHARLSIIDVSDAANQPFYSSDGRYCIVFNGEIFNYKELAQNHLKGIALKTSSDTEVLLHLFMKFGASCLQLLNGFFAFAVYDAETQNLFLARDRMGIKPLLWFKNEDAFVFGSEMKAIFNYDVPKAIDIESIAQYFQLSYIPAPHTGLRSVQKLKPGHSILISPSGEIKIEQFYKIPFIKKSEINITDYLTASNKLKELIHQSVERRMIADVPLGAFLSGGVDSSVIVACASKFTNHLKTFSIGFKDEPFFDETSYAELVANKFKTDHTVFKLSNDDLLDHVFSALDYIDDPFADSSALAVYILSKLTRKEVTVALSGDGGDELFGGYNKHKADFRIRSMPSISRTFALLNPLISMLPGSRNNPVTNVFRQMKKFSDGAKLNSKDRYWRWASYNSNDYIKDLFLQKIDFEEIERRKSDYLLKMKNENDFNEFLWTDMNLVLPNDMLTKTDLMSMANSLEVRVPLLDHTIVEYAFRLPQEFKIDSKIQKKILQDAFRDELPPEIYNRPKKGFEVPLLKWFRNELKSTIDKEYLNKDFILEQQFFNFEAIENLKKKLHSSNPEDTHFTMWALIVFQHWYKRNIKNECQRF